MLFKDGNSHAVSGHANSAIDPSLTSIAVPPTAPLAQPTVLPTVLPTALPTALPATLPIAQPTSLTTPQPAAQAAPRLIQAYSQEPVQPGLSQLSLPRPTQAPRSARPTRPTPYSRPSQQPSRISKPFVPPVTSNEGSDGAKYGRKRPRETGSPNSREASGGEVSHTHALTQVLSGVDTTTSATLADATRQLARPRDAPGSSQHAEPDGDEDQEMNQEVGINEDTVDEISEALQAENDEILRLLYGEDDASGNSRDTRLYRLVARMLQKQDMLYQAMEHLKRSRHTCDSSHGTCSAPNASLPPRISPPKAHEQVNWDQSVRSAKPAGRQPRVARRILTSDMIRENIGQLLGRSNGKQPLPPPPPPEIRYPTPENFGIRWAEMEKSIFNRLAVSIVVERVRANWRADPLTQSELDDLPRRVSEHVRYLCRTWKNSQKEDAETLKMAALKTASASSRRSTLYESRLKIIDRFPEALNMHRNLIVRLGRAGTSSDEEDPERKGVFLIKRRPELSSKVNILKSKLDLAYNLYCKGPGSKGSQMHTREPSDLVSTRAMHVEGLPITCLSRAWLLTLSEPEKKFYGFSGHKYDYTFPDQLLKRNLGRDPHKMVISDEEVE